MGTPYESDVVAWAHEQAALLRSGNLLTLDAVNIAEEIADVGKSAQHELGSRLAILIAHLLKWQFQSDLRSHSWRNTIREQRRAIARVLQKAPSLKHSLHDQQWVTDAWDDASDLARAESGLRLSPTPIWTMDQVFDPDFFPD